MECLVNMTKLTNVSTQRYQSQRELAAVSSETTTNSGAPQSANRHSSTADKNQSNTPTVTSGAAVLSKGAKLGNEPTPVQPMNKEQHRKGGFVHTLTANDGTRAQVYLSRNGAHAGIVFRNEISRGKENN